MTRPCQGRLHDRIVPLMVVGRYWKVGGAAALGYAVLALFGLQLALPPSIAGAFWPAAGLSALMMLRYGRWVALPLALGALVASYVDATWFARAPNTSEMWVWAGISLAALVRALVGLELARRFGATHPLKHHNRALALMGPAASLPASIIGGLSLAAAGFVPWSAVPVTMATWWLGDVIGTVAVWHLGASWLWRDQEGGRSLQRSLLLVTPAAALVVIAGFWGLRQANQQNLRKTVEATAAQVADELQDHLDGHVARLRALALSYGGPRMVDEAGFLRHCRAIVEAGPGVESLSWIPRVDAAERADHLARMRALGRPDYQIVAPDRKGALELSAEQPVHYPVSHSCGAEPADREHGLDVMQTRTWPLFARAAEQQALMAGYDPAPGGQRSPAMRTVFALPLPAAAGSQPSAFLAMTLRLDTLAQECAAGVDMSAYRLRLVDSETSQALLSPTAAAGSGVAFMESVVALEVPGRKWAIVLEALPELQAAHQDWASYSLLMCGMLLTGILSIFLGNLTRTNATIAREVRERTADLASLNEHLAAARDSAEQANQEKTRFLATMSHEMRTPLNGIIGGIDLLLAENLPEFQGTLARAARESSHTLLALIDDILDLSRIEAGSLVLEKIACHPISVIEEALRVVTPLARKKGLDLYYEGPWKTGFIRCDPTRLKQVLVNLVGNAVKFTSEGSVVLRFDVLPDALRIAVEDTGVGIAREQLDTIFLAFTQADASTTRKYGGTGLGLAISYRIVQAMGASMEVESALGEGSTFTVVVPQEEPLDVISAPCRFRQIGDDPQVARCLARWQGSAPSSDRTLTFVLCEGQKEAPPQPGGADAYALVRDPHNAAGWQRVLLKPLLPVDVAGILGGVGPSSWAPSSIPPPPGARALVVDDAAVNQLIVGAMLERLGYQPVRADDGEQGLARLCSGERYDVVLMDCQMPKIDGYEVTRRFREWERERGLPRTLIIALTANARPGDALPCYAAGMDEFITKPITLERLEGVLAERAAGTGQDHPATGPSRAPGS